MPKAKQRDQVLFMQSLEVQKNSTLTGTVSTGSLTVGGGTQHGHVLLGSVTFNAGSIGSGSSASATAAVTGLTASHKLLTSAGSNISGCMALVGATPGAGSFRGHVANVAGSGAGTAASSSFTVYYMAWK